MPIEKKLFTFAVLSDTHIISKSDIGTSPYAVNNLTTGRTEWAVKDIKTQQPDFVIHVGDMIRPFPSLEAFKPACQEARKIFASLPCDVHFIPGNHDVGDKPIAYAPAPSVSQDFIEKYQTEFGEHYSSFSRGQCHFVLLNASVFNSGLRLEEQQQSWLIDDLARHSGERIFVFLHYPPFLAEPDEAPHYDNIDEPGRSYLMQLLTSHNSEAVFSGHVHHFFFNTFGKTNLYCLPSPSFARHDFSELFNVEPAAEFGRNDVEKLGYLLVDVYKDSHAIRFIGTNGQLIEQGAPAPAHTKPAPLHPKEGYDPPVGVKMRHAWNEVRALPHNNPLDEFTRKKARNDYPLLATWRIGLTHLRVPLDDLRDLSTRARMAAMTRTGQKFTVVCFGIPQEAALDLLTETGDLLHGIELVLPAAELSQLAQPLEDLRYALPCQLIFAILESSSAVVGEKTKYFSHSTTVGARVDGQHDVQRMIADYGPHISVFSGVSFQIDVDDDIWAKARLIEQFSVDTGKSVLVHLNSFDQNSAVGRFDDHQNAANAALATIAAYSFTNGQVSLDTLMDIDRAHYPRHGLIDRRGNFRLSAHYVQTLLSVLSRTESHTQLKLGSIDMNKDWICARFSHSGSRFAMVLPKASAVVSDWRTIFPDCPANATWVELGEPKAASLNPRDAIGQLFETQYVRDLG